ncbi:MAG: flavodoxin family protein [Candidatus Micrarchaeia archaeon]
MRTLILCVSIHHKNTEKIANAIGEVLRANFAKPEDVDASLLSNCELIGFGSGIYFGRHHRSLFSFIDKLPHMNKKAFIFSTSGLGLMPLDHLLLKRKLIEKGFNIIGEFSCRGFNTHGPLKYIGGMNKGKPDDRDLERAREFAIRLKNTGITL